MQPPRLQGTDPGYLVQAERGTRSAQASGRVRRGSPHLGLGSTRCKRTKFVVAAKARSTSPPVPSTRRGSYPEAEPPPLALGRGASSRSRPQDLGRVPRESAASQTPSTKTWCSLFEACRWPSFAGGPASHDLPRQHPRLDRGPASRGLPFQHPQLDRGPPSHASFPRVFSVFLFSSSTQSMQSD